MEKTIVERLADFAGGLRFEDLPKPVVARANDCFFDFVGCYYGALKRDNVWNVLNGIADFNPTGDSEIWGIGRRCGEAEAAMAMGTAGYHLEFDDGISVSGHWGSASIPSCFVAVEKKGGDGKALLTSIVTAYEVGCRISRMFSPRLLKKHIHFPCTMGGFGAAAGYAKGSGATPSELAGALSLAGLFPVGTYSTATSGAGGKGLYSGWPNYLGINAVKLSKLGLTGDRDVMEAPDGFSNALGLGTMEGQYIQEAERGLGTDYRFMQVYFKPYPCCRWLHAPVHAVLRLMRENNLTGDDIQHIDIGGPEFAMMYNTRDGYDSKITCQYSIPFSVGAAALYGRLSLEEFDQPKRTSLALRRFVERVDMHVDEQLQNSFPAVFGVNVAMELADGRVLRTTQGTPWGPDAPPSRQELIEKFTMLTDGVLSPDARREWIELYQNGFQSEGAFERILALTGAII